MIIQLMSAGKSLFNLAVVLGLASLLAGCASTKKTEAAGMPAVPFDAMVIRHTVADYDKWRPAFDADKPFQEAAGLHSICVSRGLQNPNDLELPFAIDSVEKAKAFSADPRLKAVMEKAGVTGAPSFNYIRVIRMSDAAKQPSMGNYMSVAHKVKDFDAWLKVYDREGPAVRTKDGLVDAVLARGIDDPNLVFLVFQIKTLEEANAALANPERQKIMQEAGVVGTPEVFIGTDR